MGVENSIFARLLIQRTSTKNLYLIPSTQPAVRVLYVVRVLYPVHILYLDRVLYPLRSPQSSFYTDRLKFALGNKSQSQEMTIIYFKINKLKQIFKLFIIKT